MLIFDKAQKSFKTKESRKIVLHETTCSIPSKMRIGVLGMNGSGKTTLLRLISGSEPLDHGTIYTNGRVSFPVGFAGTFHSDLSGAENIEFLANIYGMDASETMRWIADFTELGEYLYMPVKTYSSGMFARLVFAASFSIDFDYYLVDEAIETGDARFRAKCAAAFNARLDDATLILVSQNMHTIRTFCNSGAVLHNGHLRFFEDLEEAFAVYETLLLRKL